LYPAERGLHTSKDSPRVQQLAPITAAMRAMIANSL
jgi:hypothetical protein